MTDHTFQLGATRVDLLRDGRFEAEGEVLTYPGGDAQRTRVHALWGDRPFAVEVNCFLMRGPAGTVLVDTGTGSAWGERLGHARGAMSRAGVTPEAVDRVFLTQIHGDHALGLLDGDAAFLPRAEIVVPEADLGFFTDPVARARLLERQRGGFDIAAKLVAAYPGRLRPVPFGRIAPGVELLPLPGHTPGQGGYLFTEGDDALLLWGDALHLQDVQAADPDVGVIYDIDPATAADTRRTILARAAAAGWVVSGGHVAGFGRVAAEGPGFRIDPA